VKCSRKDAKSHAFAHMKGIWAAGLMPFRDDLSIDEEGFAANMNHWIEDLKIDGFFIAGKQGEFFAMSLDERKRAFDLAVKAASGRAQTIMSCSDQNMDVVIDLAKHAQSCGADYIVVHAPILHFYKAQDETLIRYYETIASKVDIGIALWSHPDSGYLMSPQLCNRLADIENVVAIKYSTPRPMYSELSRLASDRMIVSTASEEEWLENILELNWQLYLCSSPPYLIQTAADKRMRAYTDAAFAGRAEEARAIRDSLDPVRHALKSTRPPEKPHSPSEVLARAFGSGGRPRTPAVPGADRGRKSPNKTCI
jgi:4-hydroxy-tetrahydrodipicolinate synthase